MTHKTTWDLESPFSKWAFWF